MPIDIHKFEAFLDLSKDDAKLSTVRPDCAIKAAFQFFEVQPRMARILLEKNQRALDPTLIVSFQRLIGFF